MYAHRIRHTQASTQIMRILDTIEDQQEWRFLQIIQHIINGDIRFARINSGCDALMTSMARHAIQPRGIGGNNTHAAALGGLDDIFGTRILPALQQVNFQHTFRIEAQTSLDGVKTKQDFFGDTHGLNHFSVIGL